MQQEDSTHYQSYILYNMEQEKIPTLTEVLDEFDAGTLDMTQHARKYYINERDKAVDKVSWIHNIDLKNQSILRGMSKQSARRDLLRNTSLL
jgi:hypothetical protein